MKVPNSLLKKLYTAGSLRNTEAGPEFRLKNRLLDAELTAVRAITIDSERLQLESVFLEQNDCVFSPSQVDTSHPLPFPLAATLTVRTGTRPLERGPHQIEIAFEAKPFGNLCLHVEDAIEGFPAAGAERLRIPRDPDDDYAPDSVSGRRSAIEVGTGVRLTHVSRSSFDPHVVRGNCENFVGVAQVPIGFAGPLRVCGEHASGEFVIPLATTEGTLVASYNRGMKALNSAGGVKSTVVADAMQRAPVFVLPDARAARDFVSWVETNFEPISRQAEATSSVARLRYIDPYLANKFAFLRFNFSTGDAAGQNMVGRATLAACNWILERYAGIEDFYLESNFATDKKASHINIMRTRGKRVTAEATIPRDVLRQQLRVEPERLAHHYGVANVGAILSGANNNGLQSANGITAMFIATGQDVANVAESSAAVVYCELRQPGDLYLSVTIPSLIVATYGGGTGLATQRECLEVLGCYGKGKVNRLAEIVAGVVLAGEISLAAAISSDDWVAAHEKFGRNR